MFKPKHAIAWAAVALTGMAHAYVPQGGTWIVSDEVNGRPGRGFAIDVQNDVLVMQVYAYESSGQPTFYMATGRLDDNSELTTRLGRYEGGRFLGSGDRSGVERGSPGNVRIRFVSGTLGYITLPGEGEKEIKRYQFGYDNSPASLLGLWSLVYGDSNGNIETETMQLTRITGGSSFGSGMTVSYDGLFACEQIIRGVDAGKTQCVKMRSGTSSETVRGFWFNFSVNQAEGDWSNTRGSGTGALYANRLMQNSGRITGLLRKVTSDTGSEQNSNDDALRAALEAQASARQSR